MKIEDYTPEQKKETAEKAGKMQRAGLQLKEISEMLTIPVSTLKHWTKNLREGKYDIQPKRESTSKLEALQEQTNIRLDSIYQLLSEMVEGIKEIGKGKQIKELSSDLVDEFNGDES